MDYNHFFNFYGYATQDGWIGMQTQLKAAGYDDSKVENTFGKGWSDNGVYPSEESLDKEGTFMSRNEQLGAIDADLDINKYELVYGKGFVSKTKPKFLTFTANEGGISKVGFIVFNDGYDLPEDYKKPSLQYSIDGGKTWQDYDLQISDDTTDATTIQLDGGESVMFRGNNENLAYYLEAEGDNIFTRCYIEGSVAASGDITSLLNGIGGDATLASGCYNFMFDGCTGLTQAPALPATTLADSCYNGMFYGCTGLTQAPALPATTLASDCYNSMFDSCTGLTQAPALPATTLADNCYTGMFSSCTGLTQAPVLPATTLADSCYKSMFSGCTSLTQAPSLPATTLAYSCYNSMFSGCTSLTQAPSLPATTLAERCYIYMFSDCTGLTQAPALPATTLADSCYSSMFSGCTGLTQAPALPVTTLASDCYNSMFASCTGLTQAPALPATTLASDCYSSMFDGCTEINSHDVETLNNSLNVFLDNLSCASFTIHAETPPTIGFDTITGLKADCIIYVPAASVDAYKAAQYWSERADYIQAMES